MNEIRDDGILDQLFYEFVDNPIRDLKSSSGGNIIDSYGDWRVCWLSTRNIVWFHVYVYRLVWFCI